MVDVFPGKSTKRVICRCRTGGLWHPQAGFKSASHTTFYTNVEFSGYQSDISVFVVGEAVSIGSNCELYI